MSHHHTQGKIPWTRLREGAGGCRENVNSEGNCVREVSVEYDQVVSSKRTHSVVRHSVVRGCRENVNSEGNCLREVSVEYDQVMSLRMCSLTTP